MRLVRRRSMPISRRTPTGWNEVALRYREVDSVRELARRGNVVVPVSPPTRFSPVAPTRRRTRSRHEASARKERNHRIIEVMAVLLLGVATIGSAWCGYQARVER